jgi:chitosanase
MDIDCDGANRQAGKCANDPTGQSQTAFQDEVRAISGLEDLDANIHPYVVFGNEGSSPSFNPQNKGMKPLSVMAVICNNQLVRNWCFSETSCTANGEGYLESSRNADQL